MPVTIQPTSLKYKNSNNEFQTVTAIKGDDGISPTVTVTDITDGHRVTITDTNGAHNFDVMDGESHALTAADKAEIAQQAAAEVDVPVQDVQVNGVSVLSDGVANVPISSGNGSKSVAGVVKTNDFFGISINSDGELHTSPANSKSIKAGTTIFAPLSVKHQHESTFYGLAKAAGADEKDSTLPVGQYTEPAKSAIRSMLGVQNFNPQSIAIVANGDTHAAITSEQYVYVQNHSTLTEGLYAASSAIAANETLSASNLTAVGSGGLNALLGKIPEQLIYLGKETDYPLSAAHTAYPTGVTLIYTAANTSYPYGTGTVVTIRSASARCVQINFGNSPDNYKMRTADSNGWSAWKNLQESRLGISTTDVKASALALINDGLYSFVGSGSTYTGDAPTSSNKYGTFIVQKRGTERVILSFYDDVVYICYYRNSAWSKWFPVDAYAMAMLGYYVYGSSATYSIPKDSFVVWNNALYKSTTAIGAGVAFGSTNLTTVPGGGLNDLKNRIMYGEASTPSDHTHYVDISRSSYNYIIACIKSNANYNICAYPLNNSAFRVIVRSADGSPPTSPVEITFALFK